MRRFLAYSFFWVFLTANISKWQMDVGVGLSYYILPLMAWCVIAIAFLATRRLVVPRQIKFLIVLKMGLLLAIALMVPVALLDTHPELPGAFVRGFIVAGVNVLGLTLVLLVLAQMDAAEKDIVLDTCLVVVGIAAAYTVVQGVGAYLFGLDLDQTMSEVLPLVDSDAASLSEDVWGFRGTLFYRLTGLTGDPNLNAAVFLVALPVAYHRFSERPLISGIVILLGAAIIAQSLSVTVIPTAILVLVASNMRYATRHPIRVVVLLIAVGGLAVWVWTYLAEPLSIMVSRRLEFGGTMSEHARIARDALRLWMDRPLGLGLNGFAIYSPDYSTHNTYLQRLVELGIPGLLVTVATVLYCLRVSVANWGGFGFVAALSAGALALTALGHDLLNRFELELVVFVLVAIAVTDGTHGGTVGASLPAGKPVTQECEVH